MTKYAYLLELGIDEEVLRFATDIYGDKAETYDNICWFYWALDFKQVCEERGVNASEFLE
jgi:hypothetical protein